MLEHYEAPVAADLANKCAIKISKITTTTTTKCRVHITDMPANIRKKVECKAYEMKWNWTKWNEVSKYSARVGKKNEMKIMQISKSNKCESLQKFADIFTYLYRCVCCLYNHI